jgi:hypothetical protein
MVALLIEMDDGLSARDGHIPVDDSASCNGDCVRHDIRVDHGGWSNLEFSLDDQASRETSGNNGGARMDLAFPVRFRSDAQRASNAAVAADRAAEEHRSIGLDVAG